MVTPKLLALDFDGVVCDGLLEYFQTAWKAYCQIFQPDPTSPPAGLAEQFYPLRPVIETGWEMPVLLYGLQQGLTDQAILTDWPTLVRSLIAQANLDPAQIAQTVDQVRDQWIQQDLADWLSLHRFYPGVIGRLQQVLAADIELVIISTKEGRFIRQLLAQQGLILAETQILGKEVNQPKYETLRQIQARAGAASLLWFVEDRIKALQAVQRQSDLNQVELFLADWGYNTAPDRRLAQQDSRIRLLSLDQFQSSFDDWV